MANIAHDDAYGPGAPTRPTATGHPSQRQRSPQQTQAVINRSRQVAGTGRPRPRPTANSRGQYTRPQAPPPQAAGPIQPSIESYLGGDTSYQQQMRDFAQALNDLTADIGRRRGTLETEYGLSSKALADQRLKDLESIEESFGSRGLLRSGLYGEEVGKYETEYGQRSSDLSRQQQQALGSLDQERGQFQAQQKLKEQAAREQAIRRRAEQFGI